MNHTLPPPRLAGSSLRNRLPSSPLRASPVSTPFLPQQARETHLACPFATSSSAFEAPKKDATIVACIVVRQPPAQQRARLPLPHRKQKACNLVGLPAEEVGALRTDEA